MAYTAANVCQQRNLPRQGFEKCVSVCVLYVCRAWIHCPHLSRAAQTEWQASLRSTRWKTIQLQRALVTIELVYCLFCCFWDSEGFPLSELWTKLHLWNLATVNSNSEYEGFCVWCFYFPLLDCESEGGMGLWEVRCWQEHVATQHCK